MSKRDRGIYAIRMKGHLGQQWLEQFDGMTATLTVEGETELRGPIPDQSALFGLLRKVRNLGVELISVNRIETDD